MSLGEKARENFTGEHLAAAEKGEVDNRTPGSYPVDDALLAYLKEQGGVDQSHISGKPIPSSGKPDLGGTAQDLFNPTTRPSTQRTNLRQSTEGTRLHPSTCENEKIPWESDITRDGAVATGEVTAGSGGLLATHQLGQDRSGQKTEHPASQDANQTDGITYSHHEGNHPSQSLGTSDDSHNTVANGRHSKSRAQNTETYWGELPQGSGAYSSVIGHGSIEDSTTQHRAVPHSAGLEPTSQTATASIHQGTGVYNKVVGHGSDVDDSTRAHQRSKIDNTDIAPGSSDPRNISNQFNTEHDREFPLVSSDTKKSKSEDPSTQTHEKDKASRPNNGLVTSLDQHQNQPKETEAIEDEKKNDRQLAEAGAAAVGGVVLAQHTMPQKYDNHSSDHTKAENNTKPIDKIIEKSKIHPLKPEPKKAKNVHLTRAESDDSKSEKSTKGGILSKLLHRGRKDKVEKELDKNLDKSTVEPLKPEIKKAKQVDPTRDETDKSKAKKASEAVAAAGASDLAYKLFHKGRESKVEKLNSLDSDSAKSSTHQKCQTTTKPTSEVVAPTSAAPAHRYEKPVVNEFQNKHSPDNDNLRTPVETFPAPGVNTASQKKSHHDGSIAAEIAGATAGAGTAYGVPKVAMHNESWNQTSHQESNYPSTLVRSSTGGGSNTAIKAGNDEPYNKLYSGTTSGVAREADGDGAVYNKLPSGADSGIARYSVDHHSISSSGVESAYNVMSSGTPSGINIGDKSKSTRSSLERYSQKAQAMRTHQQTKTLSAAGDATGLAALVSVPVDSSEDKVVGNQKHESLQSCTSNLTSRENNSFTVGDTAVPLVDSHKITHTCVKCGEENDISYLRE